MAALEADNLRLAHRAAALESAAAGWRALLESTGAVAFALDRRGVIRWLTPAASAILSLPAPGPGRRLAEVTCHLDQIGLETEARPALDRQAPTERSVTAHGGAQAWLMRLVPYAGPDGDRAAGVVASFLELGRLARDDSRATLLEELNQRSRDMEQALLSAAGSTPRREA